MRHPVLRRLPHRRRAVFCHAETAFLHSRRNPRQRHLDAVQAVRLQGGAVVPQGLQQLVHVLFQRLKRNWANSLLTPDMDRTHTHTIQPRDAVKEVGKEAKRAGAVTSSSKQRV